MAMQFTPAQDAAIHTRDKNILVSASAGSGKTRVLVQRVTERLLAGEDIDRFLIVTFTEAAAAEMKERLEGAIRRELENTSGDERNHLLRQLRLLNVANISTLHAFALRLIEQYHYAINLDPQFRLLADTAESTLLRLDVYNQLLADAYADDADGSFKTFAQQFVTAGQDDLSLQETVFNLFDFAMARPDTNDWLDNIPGAYTFGDNFVQGRFFQEQLVPALQTELFAIRDLVVQASHEAQVDEDVVASVNRYNNLLHDADAYEAVANALVNVSDWDTLLGTVKSFKLEAFGVGADGKRKNFPKDAPDLKAAWDDVKAIRDGAKKRYDGLVKKYFVLDEVGMKTALTGAEDTLSRLVSFTKGFADAFLAEKLRRKVLDFNDLEHFALDIVSQPDIADELRARYNEIMVDEYQDTNQLQEAILQQFARENNVFQVGDIKQSIYKFRQADPQLFRSKLQSYPGNPDSEVITLQENFRSRPNVTNFINYLFTQIMSDGLGDVDYRDEHKLVAGATYYPEELPKQVELMVYLHEQGDEAEDDEGDTLDEAGTDGFTKATGQITMMAHKIQALMASDFTIFDRDAGEPRKLQYGDITILVPTRNQNLDVIDVFRRLEIPITVSGAENYFQTTEISVMMSLLQVIDNPHQDIPLAATLRSPMYGLGENALTLIRLQKQDGDFYEALQAFVDDNRLLIAGDGVSPELVADTKVVVQRFMADLDRFRQLAVQNQIVNLLWDVYNVTGWMDYVGGLPSGPQRQANLHALYERAASYQKSSFVGLYQFINYVTQLQAQDKDLGEADANTASDAVQLMTIHHSKGLEFPVVFMLNTTRQMISNMDTRGDVLLDAKAGAGLNYIDVAHRLKLPTPQRDIVRQAIVRGAFAESLRVLYVALTRAEQHVFMVGTYTSMKALWQKWSLAKMGTGTMLPEWVRLEGKSFMDLAGMAMVRHPRVQADFAAAFEARADFDVDFSDVTIHQPEADFNFNISFANGEDLKAEEVTPAVATAKVAQVESEVDVTDWSTIFNMHYPFESATRATNYQSVSEIKRLFEDPDLSEGRVAADVRIDGDALTGLRFTNDDLPDPEFMQQASTRISSAAIGTATHLVMQRIDVTNGAPTEQDVRELLERLVAEAVLEPQVAALVRVPQIVAFFNDNSFGKQLVAHADSLQREVAFSLLMAANNLYRGFEGDDKVLVHGILDGYFQVGDEVWLFDYKTDRIPSGTDAKVLLSERYAGQVNVYAAALTAMGMPYPRRFIYSFDANKVIELD
jgi:ATP-dependent helicase/nuclease subunit A